MLTLRSFGFDVFDVIHESFLRHATIVLYIMQFYGEKTEIFSNE